MIRLLLNQCLDTSFQRPLNVLVYCGFMPLVSLPPARVPMLASRRHSSELSFVCVGLHTVLSVSLVAGSIMAGLFCHRMLQNKKIQVNHLFEFLKQQ